MNAFRALLFVAVCTTSACAIPQHRHPVIDRYSAANCLPLLAESRVQPPVREWDVIVRPSGGAEVSLSGSQFVGGKIVARDRRTGETHVVADAGDYVYPDDVRTGPDGVRVYVKASGLAGGLWHETWLFEYDLASYRHLAKVRVDASVLPPECPGGPGKQQNRRAQGRRPTMSCSGRGRRKRWSLAAELSVGQTGA